MGGKWKLWKTLHFGALKSLEMVTFSYEIKRHLLLGRKAMANLDSILKSRDITIAGLYNHSHGFSSEMKWSESCLVMSNSLWPHGLYRTWNSPGQNTRVSSLSLLQGIFPTQGSNPGLLHCGRILDQLSHKGSPRILECVAYPFVSRSFQPRDRSGVSCIAGGFFTNWTIKEASSRVWVWELDHKAN